MRGTERVELALHDEAGVQVGILSIHLPPSCRSSSSIPELAEDDAKNGLERVQLLEGGEYRYSLSLADRFEVTIEPREIISPDDRTGLAGRLRPGLYVGRLALRVFDHGVPLAEAAVEVRSRKLDYLNQYRWMLNDIASIASELALQRFAATEQRMTLDAELDATTLYQRFCFLKSAILGPRLAQAFAAVVGRPHVEWQQLTDEVRPDRGVRGSSLVARELAKATSRISWENGWHAVIKTLPAKLPNSRFESSQDSVPNRFVRFVLEEWRATLDVIVERLEAERAKYLAARRSVPAPVLRGLFEIEEVGERLDSFLEHPLLRHVGRLNRFPGSNQVLQQRTGYREIRELYALSEFAGVVNWDGGEDVFGAGQRNVANLYEYWVFLQLATIVSQETGGSLRLDQLIKARTDGLVLGLKQGKASALLGHLERHGTRMRIELSFNRSFESSVSGGSWTRTMKPDCSLVISPTIDDPLVESVSLHFDAKYRVDSVEEVLGQPELDAEVDDLVKMHAYRDAILRAVGAYVIYPGDTNQAPFRKFTEIVPGLGAFSMTPGPDGASGAKELQTFIRDVIGHIAMRGTRRARTTFWQSASYGGLASTHPDVPRWLTKPPADAIVLFGYVKSDEHLHWIQTTGLYNLRADDRQGALPLDSQALRADVLMLYGPALGTRVDTFAVGDTPRIMTEAELSALGYPRPGGRVYFCLPIVPVQTPASVDASIVRAISRSRSEDIVGVPFYTTYDELLRNLE